MARRVTELLWLTEPRRNTALAKVTAVEGDAFQLDRTLFAPRSRSHRHPAPAEPGHVWLGGDKRVLAGVEWRTGSAPGGGDVWHRLRGHVPQVGDAARLELDGDARLAARAHTAMHLLLAALRGVELARDPEVRGGGRFRFDLRAAVPPATLAEALAQANSWVGQDLPVRVAPWPREAAVRVLTPQPFHPPDPFPGPDVLWAAEIAGACHYPCDGRHASRTGEVGRVVVESSRAGKAGHLVLARVL